MYFHTHIYTYIHLHVFRCTLSVYVHMWIYGCTRTLEPRATVYVCLFSCTYVCVYVCLFSCTFVCVFAYTVYVCMFSCTYGYVDVLTMMEAYSSMYIHTDIHTHIDIWMSGCTQKYMYGYNMYTHVGGPSTGRVP